MSDHEGSVKPEGAEQLNIKVRDADGQEVFFKVKRTTRLSKLKKAYADRMGKPENAVRFVYEGKRINDEDTAESLDMEDQDEIDAMIEQLGGSSSF